LDNNYQIQKNATLVKSKNFHQLNKAFETGQIGEMDGALSFLREVIRTHKVTSLMKALIMKLGGSSTQIKKPTEWLNKLSSALLY
jgi:hypothetical protein